MGQNQSTHKSLSRSLTNHNIQSETKQNKLKKWLNQTNSKSDHHKNSHYTTHDSHTTQDQSRQNYNQNNSNSNSSHSISHPFGKKHKQLSTSSLKYASQEYDHEHHLNKSAGHLQRSTTQGNFASVIHHAANNSNALNLHKHNSNLKDTALPSIAYSSTFNHFNNATTASQHQLPNHHNTTITGHISQSHTQHNSISSAHNNQRTSLNSISNSNEHEPYSSRSRIQSHTSNKTASIKGSRDRIFNQNNHQHPQNTTDSAINSNRNSITGVPISTSGSHTIYLEGPHEITSNPNLINCHSNSLLNTSSSSGYHSVSHETNYSKSQNSVKQTQNQNLQLLEENASNTSRTSSNENTSEKAPSSTKEKPIRLSTAENKTPAAPLHSNNNKKLNRSTSCHFSNLALRVAVEQEEVVNHHLNNQQNNHNFMPPIARQTNPSAAVNYNNSHNLITNSSSIKCSSYQKLLNKKIFNPMIIEEEVRGQINTVEEENNNNVTKTINSSSVGVTTSELIGHILPTSGTHNAGITGGILTGQNLSASTSRPSILPDSSVASLNASAVSVGHTLPNHDTEIASRNSKNSPYLLSLPNTSRCEEVKEEEEEEDFDFIKEPEKPHFVYKNLPIVIGKGERSHA